MTSPNEQILQLLNRKQIIHAREVDALGISRAHLYRMHKNQLLDRVGRGLYTLSDNTATEHGTIIEVAARAPKSVVCLLSALQFHQLTTQLPHEVWIAIEGAAWKPQIDYPAVRVVRFSGEAFQYGIEVHRLNDVPVQVYSVAKTVADCFKFRNKIGLDVALEALRETLDKKRATVKNLLQAAKVCRVSNIMRPYLEAMLI